MAIKSWHHASFVWALGKRYSFLTEREDWWAPREALDSSDKIKISCSCQKMSTKTIRWNKSQFIYYQQWQHVHLSRQCESPSLARQPLVGPGRLKKLCPFISVEGDFKSFNPLRCRPWQISPVLTSPDFVTIFFSRGGVVSPTPNPHQSWRTDVFLLGLSPLADQPELRFQGLALHPYMS
jgi:hypothetical protein